jgi:hypothetical protein
MRHDTMQYRGWRIIPFAAPTPGGAWEATCEIEHEDRLSRDTYPAVSGPFRQPDKDEAIRRAVADAQRKIDDIEADPLH